MAATLNPETLAKALGRHPSQKRQPLPAAAPVKPDPATVRIATQIMAERKAKQQGLYLG